jgi:hypothetical protein
VFNRDHLRVCRFSRPRRSLTGCGREVVLPWLPWSVNSASPTSSVAGDAGTVEFTGLSGALTLAQITTPGFALYPGHLAGDSGQPAWVEDQVGTECGERDQTGVSLVAARSAFSGLFRGAPVPLVPGKQPRTASPLVGC